MNFPVEKSCYGKKRYTRKKAKRALVGLIMKELGDPRAGLLHDYKCPNCGNYHLGHGPQKEVLQ